MTFEEELAQLIAKYLGPKATYGDYMDAREALEKTKNRLDEEADTRFTEEEAQAWEDANIPSV
jgi:hypothetical protein